MLYTEKILINTNRHLSTLAETLKENSNLKTDILKEFVIPVPDEKSLTDFQIQIVSIFEKLLSNAKQIQTLESLRDAILPKLLSGEVRVEI